ncbi:MAG TPA: hypothetical protein VGG07_09155 [Solirubrobacteraceae bacterium]
MRLARASVRKPSTVEQLQQLGDEAHVIAGGQSLVPMTLPMWRTAWVSIGTCSATTAESASRCPR